ncbi:hypothetical protein PVL30_000691 [Lodderomyces elongisporus]|nr:uncharacterized protein PVL30_000691 [Lodderomyces elongisporus]WLF76983.1 hypothetical protein PVL30_000691 [Lodderomyces elongisporus]
MVLHEWVLHIPQTSRHYYTFEIDLYDGPYYMNETFSKLMLEEHNKLREIHGAQKLRWSTDMFEFASQYALKYNCSGILEHSGARVGENLAYGYSPQEAIQAWYEEGETYPYGTEEVYNHFTAIVWNNTESMGCAYKQCANAGLYITCNYDPPGNVINHSSRNVFPPLI